MKNYLRHTVLLTIVVIGSLLLMNKLPIITIDEETLRTVDILADVKHEQAVELDSLPMIELNSLEELKDSTPSIPKDTLKLEASQEESDQVINEARIVEESSTKQEVFQPNGWVELDTDEEGLTSIADYSKGEAGGMSFFYDALNRVEEGAYARVAVFGDSFIEGDIFTADLRSYLQSEFGGCGVGFVPITSETNGFRPSVVHVFGGWESHSVTKKNGFKYANQGISGHYFIPTSANAFVELRGQKRYATHLDTCEVATIYFHSKGPLSLRAKLNSQQNKSFQIEGSAELQAVKVKGKIGRIRWSTPANSSALFYGAAMDGESGVVVDNYSLRGSSGYSLISIPQKNLREFNALRPYDLIIIQYGLNVVAKGVYDYNYYRAQMNKVIAYLKECFPHTSFLILSVGDRDYKTRTGSYETMPEIKYFLQMQRQIAKDNKIAFWNMFEAMGGERSMYKLVHDSPSKANYDYTHINFRGGRFLAKKLFDSILDGKKNYDNSSDYAVY